jgi:uncharacterized membrane protein YccC
VIPDNATCTDLLARIHQALNTAADGCRELAELHFSTAGLMTKIAAARLHLDAMARHPELFRRWETSAP